MVPSRVLRLPKPQCFSADGWGSLSPKVSLCLDAASVFRNKQSSCCSEDILNILHSPGLWPSLHQLSLDFTAIAGHPRGAEQQKVGAGAGEGGAITHAGLAERPPGTSK